MFCSLQNTKGQIQVTHKSCCSRLFQRKSRKYMMSVLPVMLFLISSGLSCVLSSNIHLIQIYQVLYFILLPLHWLQYPIQLNPSGHNEQVLHEIQSHLSVRDNLEIKCHIVMKRANTAFSITLA